MRSSPPVGFPAGVDGEGGGGGGRRLTWREEGIVHFSVPARITGSSAGGGLGGVGWGGMVGGVTSAGFEVELWQVVNRSRRVSGVVVVVVVVDIRLVQCPCSR